MLFNSYEFLLFFLPATLVAFYFVDFSIPSPITWNAGNAYDGSHFNVSTNLLIAQRLFSKSNTTFGFSTHDQAFERYAAEYQWALDLFRAANPDGHP